LHSAKLGLCLLPASPPLREGRKEGGKKRGKGGEGEIRGER